MTTDGKKMDKLKLLIIDDDVDLCKSLNDTLELEDYLVETSHTAKDGIKKIEQDFYNIVLQDMKLPDSDGIEALQKIKEISPDIEVIMFTAFAATENVIEAMDRGAFSYLPKPFEMTDLITTLKKACERQFLLFENRNLFNQMSEGKKDWENTFDSISDLITIIDADANIVRCNKALADKMCFKTGDVIGEKCYAIFQNSDSCLPDCPALKLSNSVQKEINDKDRILLMSCSPKFDKSGIITGVVNIARDITEQKYAEEKIHKLSCAVEQSPVTTVITDTDGNIQYVNPKFSQLTGYTEEEALDQNPRILKSGKTSPGEYKKMWDQIFSGKEWHGEFCNKKKNGEIYWENAIISSIKNSAGDITNFIAIKEDITKGKKIEEELLSSEERFRALTTNIPGAVYRCANDDSWTMEYMSDEIEEITGFPSSDFINNDIRSYASIIYQKDNNYVRDTIAEGINDKKPYTLEYRIIDKNRQIHWVLEKGQGIFSDTGELKWLDGVLFDITKKRLAAEELKDSDERFRAISATANDAIIMLDNISCISFWNIASERIFGFTKGEVIGKKISEIIIPTNLRADHIKGFKSFSDTGQGAVIGKTVELTAINKSGIEFPIELSLSAVKIDGKWNAIGIIRDISERKQAEEQIQEGVENLKLTLDGVITALALTVEQRDPYTAGHQQRVSQLGCAIAEEMGMTMIQVEGVRTAGVVHDLGKMHIPIEILSRPGKLTKEEYNIVRSHAQVGYDILKEIEFPWPIANIVHQHHEKMDGSGYPLGLSHSAIIMEARILCAADVVEAMASHRPYRPALGMDKALDEITRGKGSRFDSDVVDSCLTVIKEKSFEFKH